MLLETLENVITIYTSTFFEVSYRLDGRLLSVVWKKESNQLDEEGVKGEFNRILRYVKEYGISNVIVDSRDYSFRNNMNLQTWIFRSFIPQLMDSSIKKYAIIVDIGLMSELRRHDPDSSILPVVDYFANPEDAQAWIKS